MNDIFALKHLWYFESVRINFVQYEHLCLGLIGYPSDWRKIQKNAFETVFLFNDLMFVVLGPFNRIDNYGTVMSGDQIAVAIRLHLFDDTFELPRCG